MILFVYFFFFSSRRRHTRLTCDWSSDVCSSDLGRERGMAAGEDQAQPIILDALRLPRRALVGNGLDQIGDLRSEERRVGKECRSRGSPDHLKKKTSKEDVELENAVKFEVR